MLDYDTTFITLQQPSPQRPCTVTQPPASPTFLSIEELNTFLYALIRKKGIHMAHQLITVLQNAEVDIFISR